MACHLSFYIACYHIYIDIDDAELVRTQELQQKLL